jgi:glycosyltransferase involved in cell wall biosynthesis
MNYPDLCVLREDEPVDLDALRAAFVVGTDSARLAEAVRRDMRHGEIYSPDEPGIDYRARWLRADYEAHKGICVVIPCYNYARFVCEALDSVMAQTRRPEEIVVVDDASTDNTSEIVRQYIAAHHAEGVIQLLTLSRNGDLAAAQNAGIAATTQQHIVCLDADDLIEPRYLEVLHDAMLADRSLGVAYCGVQVLRDGQRQPTRGFGEFDWAWMATPADPPRTMIPKPSMFRREMWRRAGGFHQTYRAGEDVDFWLRGLATGWNAKRATDEPLFTYRVHGNGQMSRSRSFSRIDHYKPWMRDGRVPFAAPTATPAEMPDYTHPVVSVVIPVGHGHAQYLPAALESLIGQTFREWEAVVVKDTPEALPLDAYPFAQVVDIGAGHGPSTARNAGVKAARAPLVVFLDADDWLMPDALLAMLSTYAVGNCAYVYTDWWDIHPDGQRQTRNSGGYDRAATIRGGMGHSVTILIAKADVNAVGGFDESIRGLEDWEFMAHLAHDAKCGVRVARPLLAYRVAAGTQRNVGMAHREDRARLIVERYGGLDMAKKCCGGNGEALSATKAALLDYSAAPAGASVSPANCDNGGRLMEYIGSYNAPVTFLGKYSGGKLGNHKFACVAPGDVARMERTGHWREAEAKPSMDNAPEPKVVGESVAAKITRAEAVASMQDARAAAVAEAERMMREQPPMQTVTHPIDFTEDQPEVTLTVASTGDQMVAPEPATQAKPKRGRKS